MAVGRAKRGNSRQLICRELTTILSVLSHHPEMTTPSESHALRLVRSLGIVRPVELEALGVTRGRFYGMVRKGLVERQGRGLYVASRHSITAEHTLAQVAKRVPTGVLCLLTALRFHGLTTQSPAEVWIALPEKARRPRLDYPRLRVARFSGPALTESVEIHRVERVEIRVYSAAKTVADCFKYRNKIGIDVAVEALKDFRRLHRGGATELARCARICRVARVMQPYLDATA
jgi:predicted transcriptional regulator of viral defense system